MFLGPLRTHTHTQIIGILPKFVWNPLISLEITVDIMWRLTPLPLATSPGR